MAQVPYNPVPTVPQDERLPTEGPRIDTPGAAFGANIAEGVRRVGQAGEQVGNELFARALEIQRITNETQARDHLSQLSQEQAGIQAKFDATKNQDAVGTLQAHLKATDDLRLKYRQGLSPLGQVMYDAEAGNLQNWAVRTSTAHAAQEQKTWQIGSLNARSAQIVGQQVDPLDRKALDDQIQQLRGVSTDWAKANGFEPGGIEDKEHAAELVSKKILEHTKALAATAPWQAKQLVADHRSDFRGDDYDQALQTVRLNTHNAGAKQISRVVNGSDDVAGVPSTFIDQIKTIEGFSPTAKWDVKQWSIGYGTRGQPGEKITRDEGDRRFNTEFSKAVSTVDEVNPNLTEGTRAALASLTYNTGTAWTKGKLGKLIAAGDEEGAKAEFAKYVNVAGQPNEAIAARRGQELSWFGKNQLAEKPLERRVQEGVAFAKKLDPDDLELQTAVEGRIRQDYASKRQEEFDSNFNNRQTLANFMLTNGPNGKLPTTMDDVLANPQAIEAWNHIEPTQREAYVKQLRANGTEKVGWDEASLRLYSTLKAEANTDPNAFLQRDVISMPLPNSAKVNLIGLQAQKAKDPTANPALMSTFGELRRLFPSTVPDPAVDKQGALEYQGALLDVMEQYMQEKHTKQIPYEDLKKIGAGLNATIAVPGWFGPRQEHIYELQPPSVVMDAMRAQGKDDDTIVRDYRKARSQEVFNKLFAGSAKSSTTSGFGAVVPQSK